MQNINPLTALRSLKGAPLSCLVALIFANQPVGKEWLARVTGYSDKPVSSAMDYLLEMGFVINGGRTEASEIHHEFKQLSIGNPELFLNSSRNNSDSEATTTALIVDSNNVVKKAEVVAKEKAESYNPHFSESHQILKSSGIGEPMASRLASMVHVTPYYLVAHTQQARKDKTNIRLLIHRIRSNDSTPQLNQNYHLLKCSCYLCFNLIYSPDNGYLSPVDFIYEDCLDSLEEKSLV